jgi:hypothetical protein
MVSNEPLPPVSVHKVPDAVSVWPLRVPLPETGKQVPPVLFELPSD